jgi:hypothetical protein
VGTWAPKIGESNQRPLATLRPSASLSSALNLLVQGMILAWILCREQREKMGRGYVVVDYLLYLSKKKIVYNIPIHTVY